MRIVASGDWHPDWNTKGVERFDDVSRAVRTVMDHAVQADLFVFLGDLSDPSDSPNAFRSIGLAVECVSELREHGVPSIWLAGNHDVIEDGRGTNMLVAVSRIQDGLARVVSQPTALLKQCKNGESLAFVGLPYPPKTDPYDPSAFLRGVEQPAGVPLLIAGHLWLPGAEEASESADMARGRSVFWPTEELGRFQTALAIGGHYHRAGVYGGVVIAGALQRLTFGEITHEPSFLVLEV